MSLYVDSSAFLKRYVDEQDSASCETLLLSDTSWITARHTFVEIHRNLSRLLDGRGLDVALDIFTADWRRTYVVELDKVTCDSAAEIASATGARSLDALHLAAALRVGASNLAFLTYDIRQAQAARLLGLSIKGV